MGEKIFHVQSVLGPKIALYFQGWSFFQSKKHPKSIHGDEFFQVHLRLPVAPKMRGAPQFWKSDTTPLKPANMRG